MLALPQNECGVCAHEAYSVSENGVSQLSGLSEERRRPTDMPLVRAIETQIDCGTQVSQSIIAELDCRIRLSAQRPAAYGEILRCLKRI